MSTAMTRKIALFAGVAYLGIGAIGFVPNLALAGLATDPVHNLAHLFVGLLCLWGSQARNPRTALIGSAIFVATLMLAPTAALTATVLYFASAALFGYLALNERETATA
jgi:hypothetical protein